jgi:3-hydroxyacyl-CoA dehydrogenase
MAGEIMISEKDIYRSAQALVRRYGQDAEFEAAERCDAMIEAGDPEGLAVWKRILRAVDELLAQEPPQGSHLHLSD